MRKTFLQLALCIASASSSAAFSADGLFSQVPIESVFTPPGASASAAPGSQPSGSAGTPAPTLQQIGQVSEVLRKAGFEAKEITAGVLATELPLDKQSVPVLVSISNDKSQLSLVVLLGEVKDEKQIPADKLLGLMSANRQYAPAYFSYSAKRKRAELYRAVRNQGLTSELLRDQLQRLGEIAKETQSLWNFTTSPAASPKPVAGPSTPNAKAPATATLPATAPSAQSSELAGRWSAARSEKEGFALQLNSNGTFVLVHVNQGKQSRSSGKFTIAGQVLTLSGEDGTRLAGTVSAQTKQQFEFLPQGSAGKSAPLKFQRAKT